MPESHPAAKSSLSFAKLVATPTDTAWSQAYNAGNLFACLSLTLAESNEELSLHVLGKEIFSVEVKTNGSANDAGDAQLSP